MNQINCVCLNVVKKYREGGGVGVSQKIGGMEGPIV